MSVKWTHSPLVAIVVLMLVLRTHADVGGLFNSSSYNFTTHGDGLQPCDANCSRISEKYRGVCTTPIKESGPLCTRIGRHCLNNVSCVNETCVCPPGHKGNGLIECIKESNMLCMVAADPHMVTFAKAKVDVNLPCTYRLTRFVTEHRNRYTPFAYCAVEVSATNVLSYGRYYVGKVHISVGVVDSGVHIKDVFEVYTYGNKLKKVYKYYSDVNHTRVLWGSSVHENLKGWQLYPTFDTVNNFAIVEVPECEVRIKYRAFCPNKKRQPLMPGISVMAPNNSKFLEDLGNYPASLCGTGQEKRTLFEDRARELGLKNKKLVSIYDIIHNAPAQKGNEAAAQCEEAFDVFKASNRKVDDLNYCGDILTNTKTRLCIVATHQKYRPIKVFNACMRLRQGSNREDCHIVKSAQRQCGSNWQGPHICQL